ncbi:MAG: CheR family methyltransferase [Roseovarius sp.]
MSRESYANAMAPARAPASLQQPATPCAPCRPTPHEAAALVEIARNAAGLRIDPGKVDFLSQRLSRELRRTGEADFASYCARLRRGEARDLKGFVEALTTHTTAFFREEAHFAWLAREGWAHLAARLEAGSGPGDRAAARPLTIWSAACSTGQELYTALMAFEEARPALPRGLGVEGIGTDISKPVLDSAQRGVYRRGDLSGLSEARRRRFILQARDGSDRFRIVPELRRQTRWFHLNLTNPGAVALPEADLILIRNVLIYFDLSTQAQVVARLAARLRPGGVLLTGHSESLTTPPPGLTARAPATYVKD